MMLAAENEASLLDKAAEMATRSRHRESLASEPALQLQQLENAHDESGITDEA